MKTAIPGLIEALLAKRGVGAGRRLSLSGKPVVKPGLVRSWNYAHSPSVCSLMARCAGLAAAFALDGQSVAGSDIFELLPARGTVLAVCEDCP